MPEMLEMPVGNARVVKAYDQDMNVIGVTVNLLILKEDIDKLPEMFRVAAERTLKDEGEKV